MDICSQEEPPTIGDPDHFAACWALIKQPTEKKLEEAKR
jgi:hypothetical protein